MAIAVPLAALAAVMLLFLLARRAAAVGPPAWTLASTTRWQRVLRTVAAALIWAGACALAGYLIAWLLRHDIDHVVIGDWSIPLAMLGTATLVLLAPLYGLGLIVAAVRSRRQSQLAAGGALLGLGAGTLASAVYGVSVLDRIGELAHPLHASVYPLLVLGAGAVALLGATSAWLIGPRRLAAPLNAIAALSVTLAVLAGLHNDSGLVPLLVRWAGVLGAGGLVVLGLVGLVVYASGNWRPVGPWRWAVPASAMVLAVPVTDAGQEVSWYDVLSLASSVDALLGLVLVVAAIVALRAVGRRSVRSPADLAAFRYIGIAVAVVLLAGAYSLLNSAAPILLVAAGLGAWLLLPRRNVDAAAALEAQTWQQRGRAVAAALKAGTARRALPGLQKHVRDKVAAAEMSARQAESHVVNLERQAHGPVNRYHDGRHRPDVLARAFGTLPGTGAWDRARWGAAVGALIGAPWTLLGIVGAADDLTSGARYPLLTGLAIVAPQLLRWLALGGFYGYFFTLLRGRTGLHKAVWLSLFVVAVDLAQTAWRPSVDWYGQALWTVQVFAFALTLGLVADTATLRRYGYGWRRLVDVHNLGSLTVWASSVTAAVATGLVTAILAGLQPFVVGVINPPPVPAPPPAMTGQR